MKLAIMVYDAVLKEHAGICRPFSDDYSIKFRD